MNKRDEKEQEKSEKKKISQNEPMLHALTWHIHVYARL